MKKIERQMSLILGTILSFCLSLLGIITSDRPSIMSFLLSFILSVVLSLVIGSIVPIKKVSDGATSKLGLRQGQIGTRAVEALVSDVIFTPVITVAMIILAYVMSHGNMPFVPALIGSLIKGLLVGFVILFLISPAILRFVLKKNGITMGGPQGGPPQGRETE